MSDRYYSAIPLTPELQQVELKGDEARHLVQVLRAKDGQEVVLFDGLGHDWLARITRSHKQQVTLELLRPVPTLPEPRVPLTMAVALPKGDRQKWLIEKLVELGVHAFVPLLTERGVAQPGDNAIDRLRRQVLEATKQCGRALLMRIEPPRTLTELLHSRVGNSSAPARLHTAVAQPLWCLAQPHNAPETEQLAALLGQTWTPTSVAANSSAYVGTESTHQSQAANTNHNWSEIWLEPTAYQDTRRWTERVVLVGPEGGFTFHEVRTAVAADCRLMDLCPHLLRVETAGVVLASWALVENYSE